MLTICTFAQQMRIGVFRDYTIKRIVVAYNSGSYSIYGDTTHFGSILPNEFIDVSVEGNKLRLKLGVVDKGLYSKVVLHQNNLGSSITLDPRASKTIKSRKYEDDVELFPSGNAITVVNLIDIDNYLSGVVESEGGGGQDIEYYKVQALMSRTYALKYVNKHNKEGFALCDRVHCQAYHSMLRFTPLIREAVQSTSGSIMLDDKDQLIDSYFHANCGGQTSEPDYHASRLLNSAYKLALKHERYTLLPEIESKQQELLETRHYSSIKKEELDEMQKKNRELLKQLSIKSELWFVKSYLFADLNKKELGQLTIYQQATDAIISGAELSISNTYLFNHIQAACYFAGNDYENSWKHLENNIELLETAPFLQEDFPNYYIGTLTNAIYVNEKLGRIEKADALLEILKNVPRTYNLEPHKDLLLKLFLNTSSIELSMLISRGELKKALLAIPDIEQELQLYDSQIPQQKKLFYFFQFAGINIALGAYTEALRWINEVLNAPNPDSNETLLAHTHILNLL
ncbi:SpoIID/LytB domain protein, partial [Ancylostoma ceylanicum]